MKLLRGQSEHGVLKKFFSETRARVYLPSGKREFSSVGSEHLPYKQRVGGSTPSTPTQYRQGFQLKLKPFLFLPYRNSSHIYTV